MGRQLAVVCIASLALGACATAGPSEGARDVRFGGAAKHEGPAVSEVELQQDLQRFTGEFMALVTQAASTAYEPGDTKQEQLALRHLLIWDSAALDIATGPLPDVNLLDMVVFVTLCRSSVERYWVPKVFGERGAQLASAFERSELNVWQIAAKVMTPAQQADLRALIEQWRADNPDQVRVEAVRFTDFSVHAGQVETDRAKSVSGLFGSVRAATKAADRALLLADRAMFLAHRMPFLIREQARLGAQEMMDDALVRLDGVDALIAHASETRPLVNDLSGLLARSEAAAREARALVEALDPLVAYATKPSDESAAGGKTGLTHALDSSNQLVDKTTALLGTTNTLLDRADKLAASSPHALELASQQADRMVRRWIAYLIVLGLAWSVFFWGGYYLVKRRTALPAQAQAATVAPRAGDTRRGHPLRVRPASSVHPHARRRWRGSSPPPRTPRSDEA